MQASIEQFKVDRPGRYLMRDGNVSVVTHQFDSADVDWWIGLLCSKYGFNFMWISDGRPCYQKDEALSKQCSHDLIAYLGPLDAESQDEPIDDVISGVAHRNMQEGYVERLQEADKELDAALAEIDRLKVEIDRLEKSRNHCEFCDAINDVVAIAKPRIPLTTPAIERYTTPMLGTQR